MMAPPLAAVLSIAGLIRDRRKGYAVAGLILSALPFVLLCLAFL